MRRLLALLLLAAAPVLAGGNVLGAEKGGEEKSEGVKGGKPGTNVDMPYLMAPLTENGKLAGYAYIATRLTASSDAFALTVRDKLPFIQDAFVRDVNDHGVTVAADFRQVDIVAVEARLLADAARILGAGKVKTITVCTVQIAELHTDKTPALDSPAEPHAVDAHQNPVKSRCANEKSA